MQYVSSGFYFLRLYFLIFSLMEFLISLDH